MKKSIIQINGGITINVDMSVKNATYVKVIMYVNPATCSYENKKYLASIMDDLVINLMKL